MSSTMVHNAKDYSSSDCYYRLNLVHVESKLLTTPETGGAVAARLALGTRSMDVMRLAHLFASRANLESKNFKSRSQGFGPPQNC